MNPGHATTADDQARLVALLEDKGYRRPNVGVTTGTWPQQYRINVMTGGTMHGVSGTYADLAARIAALPEVEQG
jgi:hypothetical protein